MSSVSPTSLGVVEVEAGDASLVSDTELSPLPVSVDASFSNLGRFASAVVSSAADGEGSRFRIFAALSGGVPCANSTHNISTSESECILAAFGEYGIESSFETHESEYDLSQDSSTNSGQELEFDSSIGRRV